MHAGAPDGAPALIPLVVQLHVPGGDRAAPRLQRSVDPDADRIDADAGLPRVLDRRDERAAVRSRAGEPGHVAPDSECLHGRSRERSGAERPAPGTW